MASLKAAGGYQALMNSELARPYYHNEIIMRGWPEDILPHITSSQWLEPLTSCYQTVNVMNQPEVGAWRDLELNQPLEADTISPDGFSVRICWGAYKAIKFDNHDVRMICERWDAWEAGFLDSAWNNLSAKWRCYVLDLMVLQADPCNKGCRAGRDGNVNLGCPGQPRPVNGDTITTELSNLRLVLVTRHRWHNGEMVLIVPPELQPALVKSDYREVLNMGSCVDCSLLITGEYPGQLMGFQVFETTDVQSVPEVGGDRAYYIIAAHRKAMAFVGDIIESRIVEPTEYFGTVYQMAAVWGGEAIYPDAIAIGYWKFVA